MRYLLLFIIISLFSTNVFGTHIIGGDIHVQWTSANTYNVKLKLYRDDVNGSISATMPNSVTIGIYQIGTNFQTTVLTLPRTSLTYVNLGDPCYTPDQNVVHIEEGIFELGSVNIPNYSQGYYLQYENCCRNAVIDNLSNPSSYGISLYAEIPDPSIGQNSTPDFGIYPADAYLCVNNVKNFNFPVTESDGDSLVFSLVTPLDGQSVGGATLPGSGAYPYYSSCVWAPGYNLNNICGGSPGMSINPTTGVITAAPNQIGNFVFAVRVEEYRNGVKLGESRRELQYASLPCTVNNPPLFDLNDNVEVYVNDSICIDILVYDSDTASDLYVQLNSNEFDISGTYINPTDTSYSSTVNSGCDYSFNLSDSYGDGWNGATVDVNVNGSVFASAVTGADMGGLTNAGPCGTVSIPVSNGNIISLTNWVSGTYDSEISWNITDINGSIVASGIFGDSPSVNVSSCTGSTTNTVTTSQYLNWNGVSGTNLEFNQLDTVNSFTHGIEKVPYRFCWTPGCYDLLQDFDISITAYSIGCAGADTSYKDLHISVQVPEGEAESIPTVFTPNGDNNNDTYQLKGEYDPCFDTLSIKIYNRWGQLVFESFDSFFEWNGKDIKGKDCDPGTYFVMIYGSITGTYGSFGSQYVNGYREPQYLELDNFTIQLFR
jgi:gliding motility-associated-like protein